MADDRMKHDDLNKNPGGQQGGKPGQQLPGRHEQDDEQFGQKGGSQGTKENRGIEDDEMGQGGGRGSNPGGQQGGRSGQNR